MDLKNEFVPYEQALALKELGFAQPCLGGYIRFQGSGTFELAFYKYRNVDFNTTSNIYVSAPLYQQCWRWFREKYGLYFNIHRLQHKIGTKQEFMLIINAPLRGGYYETHEQAELECLIRLIEIVKQKI
jgi:hypothetical protein